MSARIYKYLFFLTATILSLTFVFIMVIFFFRMPTHLSEELEQIRVAVVSDDGKVPFDNWIDPEILPELRGRAEVQEAFEKGFATAKRYSPTLKEQVYYVAVRLTNHEVLKLAFTRGDILSLAGGFALDFSFCLIIAICLTLLFSQILVKRLVEPFNDVDHPDEVGKVYPEIKPYVNKIGELETSLKKTAQYRAEFSANVSHELNTPVTQILSATQALQMGIKTGRMDNALVNEYLDDVIASSNSLKTLIKQVLELSKFDEKTDSLTKSDLDLAKNAQTIIDKLMRKYSDCRIRVLVNVTGKGIKKVDETLWNIVATNLIENAIKYSEKDSEVEVKITKKSFTVINKGEFLNKERIEHIFERFYRTEKAQLEDSEIKSGHGLGLAFVKRIVEAHGFKILVTSSKTKGNSFKVQFS